MRRLWICLIILYDLQAFEDASGSKHAKVQGMPWVYM